MWWLIFDPIAMSFVLLTFVGPLAFVVLLLPFCVLTVAQLVRAASSPGKEGLPKVEHSVGKM